MPAQLRFFFLVLSLQAHAVFAEIPSLWVAYPGGAFASPEPAWGMSFTTQIAPSASLPAWQDRRSYAITQTYLQRSNLSLAANHFWNQSVLLQLPMHYTFLIADDLGYADAVTLGDLRLVVQSHVLQTGPVAWHTLAGLVLPTATQGELAHTLTDLEALPRNRYIQNNQTASGGRGVRALVGLRTDWHFILGRWAVSPWSLQVNVRQPLNPGSHSPFTLIDVKSDMAVGFNEWFFLQLSGGQTRAWLPLSLLDPVAPSATFAQATLAYRWLSTYVASLGIRLNPLHGEEEESYRVARESEPDLRIRFTTEPAWQIVAAFTIEGLAFRKPVQGAGAGVKSGSKPQNGRLAAHTQDSFLDKDGDGIPDTDDRCPKAPEDFDGYLDQDGCPDADNDRDGIPDSVDVCPNDAEDLDGFQDQDGCPDLDNDGDGIPDTHDKCPYEREIVNFYQDSDGCPDEKPARIARNDLQGLVFDHGQTNLDQEADSLILLLAEKMKVYKATHIILYGHSDPTEPDGKDLGLARAKAVSDALRKHGIAGERISLGSMGASDPVVNNRSAKGRSQNRRVTLEPK